MSKEAAQKAVSFLDQSENLGGKLKNLYFVQSYAK
jgi:hypothetical protein